MVKFSKWFLFHTIGPALEMGLLMFCTATVMFYLA